MPARVQMSRLVAFCERQTRSKNVALTLCKRHSWRQVSSLQTSVIPWDSTVLLGKLQCRARGESVRGLHRFHGRGALRNSLRDALSETDVTGSGLDAKVAETDVFLCTRYSRQPSPPSFLAHVLH